MQFEELKSRLQPLVTADLDALYAQFSRDVGTDLRAFVAHLQARLDLTDRARDTITTLFPRDAGGDRGTLVEYLPMGSSGGTLPPIREERSSTGGFKMMGTLGVGAMGEVYLAQDRDLHRIVAFKQMTAGIVDQPVLSSRFRSEVQITAQLEHPNIVPVYSLELTDDGRTAYTMKRIQGKTLEELMDETRELYKQGKRIDEEHELDTMLDHFTKVCDAVAYANARGVVHRDLKPANIMVGTYSQVYVMDWGIARQMHEPDVTQPITLDTSAVDEGDLILGTPEYMSPEQADGRHDDLNSHSDQYALGLILFELASLRKAVTGKTAIRIVLRQQDGEKDPLKHLSSKVKIPGGVAAIIHKSTALKPEDRYESISQFAEDIRRFQRQEELLAQPDSFGQKVWRWLGHHKQLTVFVVSMMLMSLLTLTLGTFMYNQLSLEAARLHEEQLSGLLTNMGRQASLIDGQFLKYEGLLAVVGAGAEENLTRPTMGVTTPFYRAESFGPPATSPPDIQMSKRYGFEVSFEHPTFVVPDDVSLGSVELEIRRLQPMASYYRSTLLRSHDEEAAFYTPNRARRLMGDVGTPVAKVYVGLTSGLFNVYPGHGGFPKSFDPRQRPWYHLAHKTHGPKWGAPHADVAGLGLILPCAMALYDDDGVELGVVGLDVTFDFIIDKLLKPEDFPQGSEAFLLDDKGRIMVRSSKRGAEVRSGVTARTLRMPEFPVKAVVDSVGALRSGYEENLGGNGDDLVLYNRLHSLGWYYVVMGPEASLLAWQEGD